MENIKFRILKILFIIVFILLFFLIFLPFCFFCFFETFNELGLITLFGVAITIIIAYWTYQKERLVVVREKTTNQLKVILSLLGELEILTSQKSETYWVNTKGNLNWYLEIFEKNKKNKFTKEKKSINPFLELDHPLNPISFVSYLSIIDSSICRNINVSKLIRTLSYINDKIFQINYYVDLLKRNINSTHFDVTLSFIKEVQGCINSLHNILLVQKNILEKDIYNINTKF
jgi:hypothetical protein